MTQFGALTGFHATKFVDDCQENWMSDHTPCENESNLRKISLRLSKAQGWLNAAISKVVPTRRRPASACDVFAVARS